MLVPRHSARPFNDLRAKRVQYAFPGCPREGGEVQRRTVSVRRTQGERVEYNCYEEVGSYKSIPFSDIVKVAQRRAHVSKADTSRMSHSETAPKKSAQLSYHENIMCLYKFLRGKGYGGKPPSFSKEGSFPPP